MYFEEDMKHGPFKYHFSNCSDTVSGVYVYNALVGRMTFESQEGWRIEFFEEAPLAEVGGIEHAGIIKRAALKLVCSCTRVQ